MNTRVIDKIDTTMLNKTINNGVRFLASIQENDGSWKGDYGGPMFLLPMYIGACYITQTPISGRSKKGFIRYFTNVQAQNGSYGLHAEDSGCMFTSAICYASLRMLGVDRNSPPMLRLREWIGANGTALASASWGKFFLCLLNLYPYEGINPVLPELWSLPYAVPFHPGRLWCHARQVYLPMAYLYGLKARIPGNELIREIREDIYGPAYDTIDFTKHRNTVNKGDNYTPTSLLLRFANAAMDVYEKFHSKKLRARSLETVFSHILYEDRVTNFIDIGPVNSVYNTLVHYFLDKNNENFRLSMKALHTYICEGHDGMKMNGYNSTALWDTAFAVQALFDSESQGDVEKCIKKAHGFIKNNQVLEDPPENKKYFRHSARGGWPFSDREHGWPITDCTSEGFKAAVLISGAFNPPDDIPGELLEESIRLILSFQNSDGGWATYEKQRGGRWLELLNPSNIFGKIMIDYSYVECTSSCIQALALAQNRYSGPLRNAIDASIARGAEFIRNKQRPDGSFEGSWAICFTYGTWFGIWGLLAAGIEPASPEIVKACYFLIEHQNEDGGWGESHESARLGRWIHHKQSQVVQTAWALMALVRAGLGTTVAAQKGAEFLIERQMKNGDWPRESLVGLFNKTALINYENYRRYFPVWALGLYRQNVR